VALADLISCSASEYGSNLDQELVDRLSLRGPPGGGLATLLARAAMVEGRWSATSLIECTSAARRIPAGEASLLAPPDEEFDRLASHPI
jgi:hypothetical protein